MMRLWLKRALAPILYRRPFPELPPERLYLYLDALWRTRELAGAVVEIGCFQCGTAAWAVRMLQAMQVPREYVCVDTFGGFVEGQFAQDARTGTAETHRHGFSVNSRDLVRSLVRRWGVAEIKLIQGDIVSLPAEALPERIVVALVDVDLEAPTYAALEKIFLRLVDGGVILVDDCPDDPSNTFRGARVGYRRFVADHRLPEAYAFGMGEIRSRTLASEIS